ncbi:conserved hypothetical protein [Ricinus communis]|uniref:DUF7890 domain-containing protein n=1 Tax=Ricinus communis TaxID=3988 RepID=B9RCT1_RICCO|nr:conserved hypothetical protein [Ricinus communis]|eukprot:XP_015584563.1 uncharacterized protein LOC8287776 [Ricinus communis]
MLSSFSKLLSHTVLFLRGPKGTNFIQRDELSKNTSAKKVKKGDFLGSRELSLSTDEGDANKRSCGTSGVEEKGVIRVKVKMTKQEAARLMSKCKEGGILEFRDVARELVHIPLNRVTVESSACGYGSVLKTIPEDI